MDSDSAFCYAGNFSRKIAQVEVNVSPKRGIGYCQIIAADIIFIDSTKHKNAQSEKEMLIIQLEKQKKELEQFKLRRLALWLSGVVAGLGLLIGALGFIISAAARWG